MSTCAIAIAVVVLLTFTTRGRSTPLPSLGGGSVADAATTSAPGLRWFVGDGLFISSIDRAAQPVDGPPADWASSLHIVNPGSTPAHVSVVVYRANADASRSVVEVPPGRLYTIDLARRRDVPRGEVFWIGVDADRPVFPQMVHQTFRPWDVVPEGVTIVPPQPAPLDESHGEWIYPDAFQGGTASWLEQETLSLLNPGAVAADARLTFEFRDGRGTRIYDAVLPPGRVTLIDLPSLYPDEGTPLNPLLSGDFSISIAASRPVVTQQTRRTYWRGRTEVTSLSARVPLRRVEVAEAREWYYAGGWTRDLKVLPRDGQTDRTWHLLFTYPFDGVRQVEVEPSGLQATAPARRLSVTAGRPDLQWLHLSPWHEQFGEERPWGFSLRADGPVAPAVTTAEFEPWSQAMPSGMGAGNLVSDVAARRRESWLGVGFHGGSDDQPTDWSSAWQLFNPGSTPLRGTLFFHTDGAEPIVHPVTVAPRAVARVSGDAVPGLPQGRPFVVMATADQPFAAHAWTRAHSRGVPVVRAMSSGAGVAIRLATENGGDTTAGLQ